MRNSVMPVASPDVTLPMTVGPDVRAHVDSDGRLVSFDQVSKSRPRSTGIVRFLSMGSPVGRPLQSTRLPVRWWPDSQGRLAAAQVF